MIFETLTFSKHIRVLLNNTLPSYALVLCALQFKVSFGDILNVKWL